MNNYQIFENSIVYVDVDDTIVRSYGSKRIPIVGVIEKIKKLKERGVKFYCWSSGGAEYAQNSAKEFNIEECFEGFLPKPNILIDDVDISKWKKFLIIHPNELT